MREWRLVHWPNNPNLVEVICFVLDALGFPGGTAFGAAPGRAADASVWSVASCCIRLRRRLGCGPGFIGFTIPRRFAVAGRWGGGEGCMWLILWGSRAAGFLAADVTGCGGASAVSTVGTLFVVARSCWEYNTAHAHAAELHSDSGWRVRLIPEAPGPNFHDRVHLPAGGVIVWWLGSRSSGRVVRCYDLGVRNW
jgi:hypothetical protein